MGHVFHGYAMAMPWLCPFLGSNTQQSAGPAHRSRQRPAPPSKRFAYIRSSDVQWFSVVLSFILGPRLGTFSFAEPPNQMRMDDTLLFGNQLTGACPLVHSCSVTVICFFVGLFCELSCNSAASQQSQAFQVQTKSVLLLRTSAAANDKNRDHELMKSMTAIDIQN